MVRFVARLVLYMLGETMPIVREEVRKYICYINTQVNSNFPQQL